MTTPRAAWRPHTETPAGPDTAIIAIRPPADYVGDVETILLGEVYRYDMTNGWRGEIGGFPIKHAVFWWMREDELLQDLPQ